MAKQQPTASGRKLATKVEGHEIQKPRLLDADHDREITRRNDAALTGYAAETGIREVEAEVISESPTPQKTGDVKAKE